MSTSETCLCTAQQIFVSTTQCKTQTQLQNWSKRKKKSGKPYEYCLQFKQQMLQVSDSKIPVKIQIQLELQTEHIKLSTQYIDKEPIFLKGKKNQ